MSLSKDILNGDIASVKRRIQLGALVNEFDSYGYTPLIMAIMTHQIETAQLLMSHGADVNRPDIFGQPPLHWAVKLEDTNICSLLLKRGAFGNTFSSYGEPLLVYPLLKKNMSLIQALEQAGTHRSCAEDYIFTKYLGHHFELQGFGSFKNYNNIMSLVDYQGFRLEFSLHQLFRQLEAYLAIQQNLPIGNAHQYLDIMERGIKLRSIKKVFPSDQEKECVLFLKDINLIPMAFDGHAVSLIYSKNYVALCDRALNRPHTVMFYQLPKSLDMTTVTYFLYGKKSQLFWQELPVTMNWRLVGTLPIEHQKVGNCAWANLETAPVLIAGLLQLEMQQDIDSNQLLSFFNSWIHWSQSFLLKQAALKMNQQEGDRRFALALSLFDIMLQHSDNQSIIEQLQFLFSSHYYKKELTILLQQHSINSSPYKVAATQLKNFFKVT
jgi:hypothetical protein